MRQKKWEPWAVHKNELRRVGLGYLEDRELMAPRVAPKQQAETVPEKIKPHIFSEIVFHACDFFLI